MNMTIYIIVWILGAIISFYVTYKYVKPFKVIKELIYNKDKKYIYIDLIVWIFTICGYVILSWIGALVTYIMFNNVIENN